MIADHVHCITIAHCLIIKLFYRLCERIKPALKLQIAQKILTNECYKVWLAY